ncbi:hypothetical protein ABZ605_27555 [Streptomyces sp. NPDC012765]|uniref:hypothetical protein n=1 Tax=Streptomyces sp. NPDC012765 TaxID=3155249 RepID=UPI003409C65B
MSSRDDHWVRLDPAGCAHSSAGATGALVLGEDAYRWFVPKLADRRREAAEGWTLNRVTHEDWDARYRLCLRSACAHQAAAPAPEVRALTVRQPWAWALLNGKHVENRSWPIPTNLVGSTVLLHAGKDIDRAALRDPRVTALPGLPARTDLPTGVITAVGRLTGCHFAKDGCCAPWGEPEVYHWELAGLQALPEPVAAVGKLGLWHPPADVTATITTRPKEERR